MRQLTDLQKIAVDLYEGNMPANYSTREAEDILREAISELICRDGKPNYNKYSENKHKLFQLLEDIFEPVAKPFELPQELRNLIRVETIGWGESKEFTVEDTELFKVYKISDGNLDIRRQTLVSRRINIQTTIYGVKFYAELSDFLAGRVNWVGMVNRVNDTFANLINRNMAKLFGDVATPIKTGNGSFNPDTLIELIQLVKDEYNSGAVIYGNLMTLGKIQDVVQSEDSKKEFNAVGYYGHFRGTPIMEMPVENNKLVILPYNGSPIGYVLFEGTPIVRDTADFGERNDMQLELFARRSMGFASVALRGAVYNLE